MPTLCLPPLEGEQITVHAEVRRRIARGEPTTVVGGYAGTGKSVLLAHLVQEYAGRCAVGAFAGKAAEVLRQKGVDDAQTLHSLLYTPWKGDDGRIHYRRKETLEGVEVIFVDEASMVPRQIDEDLRRHRIPIVYHGDHGQLEPVGDDPKIMAAPDLRLETLRRNAGEIAHLCEHVRRGKPFLTFPRREKVHFVPRARIRASFLSAVDQTLCAFNRTRVEANDKIRVAEGRITIVEPGDRVICLRNNRELGLFNGMQGTVERVWQQGRRHLLDLRTATSVFPEIRYDPSQFGRETTPKGWEKGDPDLFDHARCITVHKAQGSEWRRVAVLVQECDRWDMTRWLYTAFSRAMDQLYICPRDLRGSCE